MLFQFYKTFGYGVICANNIEMVLASSSMSAIFHRYVIVHTWQISEFLGVLVHYSEFIISKNCFSSWTGRSDVSLCLKNHSTFRHINSCNFPWCFLWLSILSSFIFFIHSRNHFQPLRWLLSLATKCRRKCTVFSKNIADLGTLFYWF